MSRAENTVKDPTRKTMGKTIAGSVAVGVAAAILLSAGPTRAQPVADFYRGKTLRMLIGYGPGGGYDIYGRLVAEFLPRHLPGKPTIIAQNMPGAGSFAAASYIQDVAPKDGTVFGSLAQTLALDSMTNTSAKVDVAKMPEKSFGYVPTPALVAPIEFTLRADDYAALGGYASRAVTLEDVLRANKVRLDK